MEFKDHSDESLIDYAAGHALPQQGPAAMEMQRRLLVAIREFNTASGRQATSMIRLTQAITGLTVALLVIAGFQLWIVFRPVSTPGRAAQSSTAQESPDRKGWFVESYEGGIISARHEDNTYTATCLDSNSYNNPASITDPNNVHHYRTCDLPIGLVGHLVQPFDGNQADSDGKVVAMFNVGNTLAIRSWRDAHSPWRLDRFTVTSVIAKR